MNHTPAPWHIEPDSEHEGKHPYHSFRKINAAMPAPLPGEEDYQVTICRMMDSPTIEADARLIAAAPDLLAALVSASQLIPVIPLMHPDDIQALQTRVINAIAKAKGES